MQVRTLSLFIVCLMMLIPSMSLGAADLTENKSTESESPETQGGLQKTMQENRLLSRIYPLLFRDDNELIPPMIYPDYEQWTGRRIGKIDVVQMDVFTPQEGKGALVGGVVDLGNYLHYKTRERIIRDMLFFSEGDTLQLGYLESNIQYIYDQDSFSEVSFILDEMENGDIEITVMVRDKFFLQIGGKYISRNKYNIRITDRNLLGTGHALRNSWYVDPQNQGSIGWESSFTNPNILGTFLRGDLAWTDMPGFNELHLDLSRPFLFPLFKQSGGVDYRKTNISTPRDTSRVKKQEAGLWYAHSFDFWDYPKNSYAAFGLEYTRYPKRPIANAIDGMPWQESILALGSLALLKNNYGYLPGISSFLDNDYLPLGYLMELYGGHEFGEYKNRPFAGVHSAWSIFPADDQFLFLRSTVEGFLDRGAPQQAVISIEPMYISQSKSLGQVKGRSFIRARYVHGHNLMHTESLSLKSDPLYRGNQDLQGSKLYSLSLEEDLYLPISLWGFQITVFGFADLAVMEDSRKKDLSRQSVFSEGVGVRLRNPSLIWDFIELYVGLEQLGSESSVNVELNLKRGLSLEDFKGRRPRRYKFQ